MVGPTHIFFLKNGKIQAAGTEIVILKKVISRVENYHFLINLILNGTGLSETAFQSRYIVAASWAGEGDIWSAKKVYRNRLKTILEEVAKLSFVHE